MGSLGKTPPEPFAVYVAQRAQTPHPKLHTLNTLEVWRVWDLRGNKAANITAVKTCLNPSSHHNGTV